MFHQGRSRFKALRIIASSFPPTELNCTPIPLPGLELRTTASSFSSPSTMAKISFSGVPTATTSFVTMNAPEALKSKTREVCLCFSNLHDTHIPVGVDTRRSFLLSGPASGFDPRSVLSVRNFNKSPDYCRAPILLDTFCYRQPIKSKCSHLNCPLHLFLFQYHLLFITGFHLLEKTS